jgi:hypothetical protein
MSEPLSEALVRWEEARATGRDLTPAELLPEHPELHPVLGGILERLRAAPRRRAWLVPVLATALILALVAGASVSAHFAVAAHQEASRANAEAAAARQAEQDARDHEQRALENERQAQDQRCRAEQALYAQQIALAQRAWEEGNQPDAQRLLDGAPPARRDWEMHHLGGAGKARRVQPRRQAHPDPAPMTDRDSESTRPSVESTEALNKAPSAMLCGRRNKANRAGGARPISRCGIRWGRASCQNEHWPTRPLPAGRGT